MTAVEKEFREAKIRIQKGKPINVPKGTKMNRDTVALEAGRKKGSIRYERYPALYNEIEKEMGEVIETPLQLAKRIKNDYKDKSDNYKELLGKALGRELMLIERVRELEKELKLIKQNNPLLILKPAEKT